MNPIRLLQQEDFNDSLALSEFAFQQTLSSEEREARLAVMKTEEVWGFFDDNRLAAKLMVLNLNTWIHGKVFQMGGIASVATWPEYRRQGMVGQLLSHSLNVMKDAGQVVSFLSPFSFSFYRKYGWEGYSDYMRYELAANQLPKPEVAEGGTLRRIEADPAVLNPIYEAYAQHFNGMLVRTEVWWKRVFNRKQGIITLYLNPAGEPEGYLIYQVKERVLTVHEMVPLSEDAHRALWRLISNHDSMIEKVVCQGPVDDPLAFRLTDPRIKQEVVPYFMARIVDAEAFLRLYPFEAVAGGAEGDKPLYLQVHDQHAEWNNGIFRIHPGNGKGNEVYKLEEAEHDVISCDIQTLAALLMGYKRASLLHRIGRLHGGAAEIARLERYIPERTTYLTDFF